MKRILTFAWQHSMVALLCVALTVTSISTTSCSLTSVLAEGEKILSYLPLAANVGLPLICIDATLCPAATAAIKTFDAAQAAVLTLFQQWQAASGSAQPGVLAQLQAALATLQQQYQALLTAFRVTDAKIQAEVSGVLAAIQGGLAALGQLIGSVTAAGGTHAALAKSLKDAKVSFTSANLKANVLRAVNVKTGDATLDPINVALTAQVKAW
jgi:hypothetical protein